MGEPIWLTVNGKRHQVRSAPDVPLLYVLRNELMLNSPQLGCGLEQCGACTVLVGAKATKSCKLPVADVAGAWITTLEGLIEDGELHPLQRAFVEEQAMQCGYCISGIIMTSASLLWKNPHPSDELIRETLDGNLCRCGSHLRIIRAVKRAAKVLAEMQANA